MKSKTSDKKEEPKKTMVSKTEKIIPPEKYFFVCNGIAIKSIFELAEQLEHMADDVFRYHVNAEKNDFANWIKFVFGEKALAEQLYHAKDKKAIEYTLLKYCARKSKK